MPLAGHDDDDDDDDDDDGGVSLACRPALPAGTQRYVSRLYVYLDGPAGDQVITGLLLAFSDGSGKFLGSHADRPAVSLSLRRAEKLCVFRCSAAGTERFCSTAAPRVLWSFAPGEPV